MKKYQRVNPRMRAYMPKIAHITILKITSFEVDPNVISPSMPDLDYQRLAH